MPGTEPGPPGKCKLGDPGLDRSPVTGFGCFGSFEKLTFLFYEMPPTIPPPRAVGFPRDSGSRLQALPLSIPAVSSYCLSRCYLLLFLASSFEGENCMASRT